MRSILEFFRPVPKAARGEASDPPAQRAASDAAVRKRPRASPNAHCKASRRRDKQGEADKQRSSPEKTTLKKQRAERVPAGAVTSSSNANLTGLSEYELKRRARMEANARFLRDLGLKHAQMDMAAQLQADSAATQKKKQSMDAKRKRKATEALQPVRRSMRLRGEAAVAANKSLPEDDSHESDDESMEHSFDDSSVLRYTMDGADTRGGGSRPSGAEKTDKALAGFTFASQARRLSDPMLKKVYTISFSPFQQQGLIATGGHQGRVSIYPYPNSKTSSMKEDSDKEENDDAASTQLPLMSFKAHSGWVSSVSLAKSVYNEKNRLLTAANDGVVKLWDLNRSSLVLQTPQELLASKTQHTKGIFGMDVSGDAVLTCSKDSTIALSHFDSHASDLKVVRRFEDHEGVVKSVRFAASDTQRFASGGNDRALRVFDLRLPAAKAAALIIPDAHPRAINSVQFHPTDAHLLLSASFDPTFNLFDLRKSSSPACTFHGTPPSASRSDIYHPVFVREGQEVAAACGYELSLYRTSDGATISRGDIDAKADCIAADPFEQHILLANSDGLQFAECVWKGR